MVKDCMISKKNKGGKIDQSKLKRDVFKKIALHHGTITSTSEINFGGDSHTNR